MNSLQAKIEALLFYRGEPQELRQLARSTNTSEEAVRAALVGLVQKYNVEDSGIQLVTQGTSVALASAAALQTFIESSDKLEHEKELSQAALETLTLILYQAPVARSTIDRVRGVNSSYILRHLLMRGMIKGSVDSRSLRTTLYTPTVELLAYLGLTDLQALPEGTQLRQELAKYLHLEDEMEAEQEHVTVD